MKLSVMTVLPSRKRKMSTISMQVDAAFVARELDVGGN